MSKTLTNIDSDIVSGKIYLDTYEPTNTSVAVYVSPDESKTWRETTLNDTIVEKINDELFINKKEFTISFDLLYPEITEHSIISSGGSFLGTETVNYVVSFFDADETEIYHVADRTAESLDHSEYAVTDIVAADDAIKLTIDADPNMTGFKVYRQVDEGSFVQIFNSNANSTLSVKINADDGPDGTKNYIQISDNTEFPESGIVRVENEYISYTSTSGTTRLVGLTRGLYGTTSIEHIATKTVYLYDYADENENVYNGKNPKLNSDNQFYFTDNNTKYRETATLCPVDRTGNTTVFSPTKIKIKIVLGTTTTYNTAYVKNLISVFEPSE